MSNKNTGAQSANSGDDALAKIRRLTIERNEAWDRAHEASRELYEAIEASGISPTKISQAAPISRSAIYSLKYQMTGHTKKKRAARRDKK